jgi:hypothetical protein
MLAYLLAFVLDVPASEPPPVLTPPHNYLNPPAEGCDSRASSDEVVICGNKDANEGYRLHPVDNDPRFVDAPVRAQMKIGDGTLALHNEDKGIGGGMHSKRAMITFTLPF